MKTHLIVSGDFVCTGGMDRANFALADFLSRQGDAVHLVGYRAAPELVERTNVEFHQITKLQNSYFLSDPLLRRAGKSWSHRLGKREGMTLVNGGNCDLPAVNWVHYVHAAYKPQSQGSILRKIYQSVKRRRHERTERRSFTKSPLMIVNSKRTQRDLEQCLNIPQERMRLVYYSVDLEQFYPASETERAETRESLKWNNDRKVILFVGSPSDPRKGFETLLEAWKLLDEHVRQDLLLVVLGSCRPEASQQIAEAGLGQSIQLLGLRPDLPKILRASDALVSPTRYEAYGLAVHEAVCCGIPSFVSADAGVAEQYPESLTEFLLPDFRDAKSLADRLRQWHAAPDQHRSQWMDLSTRLRSYTWDDASRQILEYSETLC